MGRQICPVCNTRTARTGPGDDPAPRASDLCNTCYTMGGWENSHDDEGHDQDWFDANSHDWRDSCWVCHPELVPGSKATAKAKAKPAKVSPRRAQLNHRTQCTHPQTPAARRACRTAYWAEQAEAK